MEQTIIPELNYKLLLRIKLNMLLIGGVSIDGNKGDCTAW